MGSADKYKQLRVESVVASRCELKKSKECGAEDVALFKTEHMFFHTGTLSSSSKLSCPPTRTSDRSHWRSCSTCTQLTF
jgi:hypothetical protein